MNMNSKNRFKDWVVLITGASTGIGRSTAINFAKEGAKVVLVSRSKDKLDKVADEIREFTENVLVIPTDVTSKDQVDEAVEKTILKFGRIDFLFNNAGSSHVGKIDDEDFIEKAREIIEADYFGKIYFIKAVLPIMKSQGSGNIMNMSSVVGRKAFPNFGAYSSIMHAITGLNASLRQELVGTGINVSIIHPALTQTPLLYHADSNEMPPMFKFMTPLPVEKVAKAVLDGVYKKKERIVLPFQPRIMMLMDAISPKIGDAIVSLMPNKWFMRLLRMYKGNTYQHSD